jgi:hypothetical protein
LENIWVEARDFEEFKKKMYKKFGTNELKFVEGDDLLLM